MLKPAPERQTARIEEHRRDLRRLFEYLETALGEQPYFLGELSLADIDILPRLLRAETYGALPAPNLPRLSAWLQRMKLRSSVKAIL
jgi:glutathione S-transferase